MEKPFPLLKTPRLRLRQACLADVLPLLSVMQDARVLRYFGMEAFRTDLEALDEISCFNRIFTKEEGIRWVITMGDVDRYCGDIGFHKYHKFHARAELGYRLHPQYWGQGITTEAAVAVLNYGFSELSMNRVEALVDPRNAASLRVLEKLRFQREGLLRDYEFENGIFVDLLMFSLLKKEWCLIKDSFS